MKVVLERVGEDFLEATATARMISVNKQKQSGHPHLLPSILKTHFQEKSVVPADSSPVILVMLEMR